MPQIIYIAFYCYMNRLLFILLLLTGLNGSSKDLDMFSLNGPVDSLCVIMDDAGLTWQTEFKFNQDGLLVEFDGIEIDTERDGHNRIVDFIIEEDDEDNEPVTIETKLEYDAAGRVIKTITTSPEEEWTETFIYDEKGRLKMREYTSVDATERFTYVYLKEDSNGNWTERQEKIASMDQVITQTRHIIYRTK